MERLLLLILYVICSKISVVFSHGRLLDPPGRSTMWRHGYNTPHNYNDNQMFCGGVGIQYGENGGKCGICGDPYNGVRENEAGGKYATGIIVRQYNMNSVINVTYQLTANHKGWVEFKICPNNDINTPAKQECLDRYPLRDLDGNSRFMVPLVNGKFTVQLQLPTGLTCSQCVFQWRYHAGNSWGTDLDGTSCIGCGDQEEFYGCADVMISQSTAQVTDPAVAIIPEGNDPNMTDYEDWDWDTEPPGDSNQEVSGTISPIGCLLYMILTMLLATALQ